MLVIKSGGNGGGGSGRVLQFSGCGGGDGFWKDGICDCLEVL